MGYASVPPLIGFLACIVKYIFGYSVFGIRFIPAILGAGSIFIIAKIVEYLGGKIKALIIASTAFLLSPGLLLFDTLFTPNVIEQFLWLTTTFFIFKLTSTSNTRYWILIGIQIGICFLNKYTVIFFITGFIFALAFSDHRNLFQSRYFYGSMLIALIIFMPNIIWQYNHGWPVFHHISELKKTQLVNMKYSNFVVDIISLNSAYILIWLIGLFAFFFFKSREKISIYWPGFTNYNHTFPFFQWQRILYT